MHQFASFVISMLYYDYHYFQTELRTPYLLGAMIGIVIFGALSGNILNNRMYDNTNKTFYRYLAIAFLHVSLIIYIILSFYYNESIAES